MSASSPPLFEVVIAAYGESPYLQRTLQSAVTHLSPAVKITVLDDCSPTGTVRRIAHPFASRVTYARTPRNLGVSGAFNEAMTVSKSRFTVLCGPDDLFAPNAETVYRAALTRYPQAAAVQPGVSVIDAEGRPVSPLVDRTKQAIRPRAGQYRGQPLARRLLVGNWTYNPSLAWCTDWVRANPFDTSLHTAMDLDLLLRLSASGQTLAVVDEVAFYYRRHPDAVSSINAGVSRLTEELAIHDRYRLAASPAATLAPLTLLIARSAPTARSNGALMAATPHAKGQRLATLALSLGLRSTSPASSD